MMLTTVIGAMTLAALGPNQAINYSNKDQISAPGIVEIRAEMMNSNEVRRSQTRFSNQTRGTVVAVSNPDGSVNWAGSDRETLGGQDAPALIYIQMFDGIFAIDPFMPLPAANDSTAAMLFLGTSLETDRSQNGRMEIDRVQELFRKLEQARHNWLRDNGYFGVQVFTNPNAQTEEHAKGEPKPAAVFERPVDVPRIKSREQVKGDDLSKMPSVAVMLNDDEPIRISLPHNMAADVVARVEKMNESQAESTKVALDK